MNSRSLLIALCVTLVPLWACADSALEPNYCGKGAPELANSSLQVYVGSLCGASLAMQAAIGQYQKDKTIEPSLSSIGLTPVVSNTPNLNTSAPLNSPAATAANIPPTAQPGVVGNPPPSAPTADDSIYK